MDYKKHIKKLNSEQKAEDDFFAASDSESSKSELYKSLIFKKTQSILFFEDIIKQFNINFEGNLLELGGGYGYLSAYIKKRFPKLKLVYTDVSEEAVKKSKQYEKFFGVKLDEKWVTSAENTPFSSKKFENILFFASFHHVQDPEKTVRECSKILKKNGKLYLLMEPSCPIVLKSIFNRHTKRMTIKENSYSIGQYRKFFEKAGLEFVHYNYKNFSYRWKRKSTIYYLFLSLVPNFLTNLFPCTQVMVGRKK